MNKSIIKIGFAAYVLLTGVAHGTAFAQEIAERPAPEFKRYEEVVADRERINDLEDRAKQSDIALCDEMAKIRILEATVAGLQVDKDCALERDRYLTARVEKLEAKISRIIKILKLHTAK